MGEIDINLGVSRIQDESVYALCVAKCFSNFSGFTNLLESLLNKIRIPGPPRDAGLVDLR